MKTGWLKWKNHWIFNSIKWYRLLFTKYFIGGTITFCIINSLIFTLITTIWLFILNTLLMISNTFHHGGLARAHQVHERGHPSFKGGWREYDDILLIHPREKILRCHSCLLQPAKVIRWRCSLLLRRATIARLIIHYLLLDLIYFANFLHK